MSPVSSEMSTDVDPLPTRLANLKVPATTKAPKTKLQDDGSVTRLEDGYRPHRFDVFCTREKENYFHVGNNRFRLLVDMRVERYMAAKTRTEKSVIVKEIIHAVRGSGGRFIRKEVKHSEETSVSWDYRNSEEDAADATYFDIGNRRTIDKVGHALRAAVNSRGSTNRTKSLSASGSMTQLNEVAGAEDHANLEALSTQSDGKMCNAKAAEISKITHAMNRPRQGQTKETCRTVAANAEVTDNIGNSDFAVAQAWELSTQRLHRSPEPRHNHDYARYNASLQDGMQLTNTMDMRRASLDLSQGSGKTPDSGVDTYSFDSLVVSPLEQKRIEQEGVNDAHPEVVVDTTAQQWQVADDDSSLDDSLF